MCGISAYCGNSNCEEILLSFLEKLEYRGYDSAGIAVKNSNQILLTKDACKIAELKQKVTTKTKGIGIAHTRWATHGKATKANAHPHYSNNKIWYVVHNGIIENYEELKKDLINKGVAFNSETDSEVIPNMLEVENVDNISSFIKCISKLNGSYAICAISKNLNELYLARYKSSLYITKADTGIYVSSDPICFAGISDIYYTLQNNEFCQVCDNNILFYNNKCKQISKTYDVLNSKYTNSNKDIYSSFMEKEINEIPKVLNNIVNEYIEYNYFKNIKYNIFDAKRIVIIGCGTAYHSGLIGATYLEKSLNIPVEVKLASEFLCSNPIINKDTAYIFVSQSGETADTLSALNLVKDKCLTTIAITNVVYSTLAKNVDAILPVFAGPEIAVASTKAYNAQLLIFYILGIYLQKNNLPRNILNKLKTIVKKIDIKNMYYYNKLKNIIPTFDSIFILGKHTDYYTAMEASLKLREITYHNISALPSGELKHGTLALVDNNTTCIIIATNKNTLNKNLNAIHEIKARGGKVIIVTNQNVDKNGFDFVIELPSELNDIIDIVSVIPFQLLALEKCFDNGYNPDKPRNLAKSVTVE